MSNIKKIYFHTSKAFTMLELIFVIMILGIVASIGSSIIARIYDQYLVQRASHRASLKTELAAQQIANLLSYRIPLTTLAKDPTAVNDAILVTDDVAGADITHTLLEWIGFDNDGFAANILPPWNGFCDLNVSGQANIITPASDLPLANTIISNLSNNGVRLNGGPDHPAIFFRDRRYSDDLAGNIINYAANCMGMTAANTTCISTVRSIVAENLAFRPIAAGRPDKVIAEHYKLAWSAYAICPTQANNGVNVNLNLIYNYQPWEGERLANNCTPPAGAQISTLITNVTVFKFAESGNTFRFKLCTQENIGDFNVTICKEKAIVQ